MAYLGGMNTSLALLAYLRLFTLYRPRSTLLSTGSSRGDVPLDVLALTVLGLANFSQAFLNWTLARRSGRWIVGHGFDRITVLDTLFTILDSVTAFARATMV